MQGAKKVQDRSVVIHMRAFELFAVTQQLGFFSKGLLRITAGSWCLRTASRMPCVSSFYVPELFLSASTSELRWRGQSPVLLVSGTLAMHDS